MQGIMDDSTHSVLHSLRHSVPGTRDQDLSARRGGLRAGRQLPKQHAHDGRMVSVCHNMPPYYGRPGAAWAACEPCPSQDAYAVGRAMVETSRWPGVSDSTCAMSCLPGPAKYCHPGPGVRSC